MHKLLTLTILLTSLASFSQIPADFPIIGKNDLPEAQFKSARHFTGESLFGYMNGGAELYREYGISNAVITEFETEGRQYKCEVYKMTGQEEAFGIYSVSGFRCLSSPGFARYTCHNKYQLQLCKGQYYVSIINRGGTSADSLTILKAAVIIADKITEKSFDLRSYIPDADPEILKGKIVLVKGKLGLANGAPVWEDYFSEITDYSAVIFSTDAYTLLSVKINDPDEFSHFITSHGWGSYDLNNSDYIIIDSVTLLSLGVNHLLIKIEN